MNEAEDCMWYEIHQSAAVIAGESEGKKSERATTSKGSANQSKTASADPQLHIKSRKRCCGPPFPVTLYIPIQRFTMFKEEELWIAIY